MAECTAVAATGKHRRAVYREGSDRRVTRCQSCHKLLGEIDDETAPAPPAPEPVDVSDRETPPAAPEPEPVDVTKPRKP